MIRETVGNILMTGNEAVVNPVNTVGVMGAGLALQFKRAYPDMFREYAAACHLGGFHPGNVIMFRTGSHPQYVISFATKRDWRQPSRLEWIDGGLIKLRETVESLMIRSIAIPPLGCGLGGLDWTDVRLLVEKRLGGLPGVDVVVYAPAHAAG